MHYLLQYSKTYEINNNFLSFLDEKTVTLKEKWGDEIWKWHWETRSKSPSPVPGHHNTKKPPLSQVLPFMTRGERNLTVLFPHHPLPPQAHVIWFFSALHGNCTEVLNCLLLAKSKCLSCIFLLNVELFATFLSKFPTPLPFITCHFSCHLPTLWDHLFLPSLVAKLNVCFTLWLPPFHSPKIKRTGIFTDKETKIQRG